MVKLFLELICFAFVFAIREVYVSMYNMLWWVCRSPLLELGTQDTLLGIQCMRYRIRLQVSRCWNNPLSPLVGAF